MSDKKQYRVLKSIFAYGDQQRAGTVVALTDDEAKEVGLDRLECLDVKAAAPAAAPAPAPAEPQSSQEAPAAPAEPEQPGEQPAAPGEPKAEGEGQSGAADKEDLSDL